MLSKLLKKNNFKILEYLLKEEESLSGLARRLKITKARTFHSLKELGEMDFVRKKIKGKTHICSFNFLHSNAKSIIKLILFKKKKVYNTKFKGLPNFIDAFLQTIFKTKYYGCIFFGSSLEEKKFKDIDLFILLENFKQKKELKTKLKMINESLSPIFGTMEEIKKGAEARDMLYHNIINGLPFSCENFIIERRYYEYFLKRKDIEERFILGYREILSCLEHKEKEYIKKHLETGIMDIVYASLNYFDLTPRTDKEAIKMFRTQVKLRIPAIVNDAVQFANKVGKLIL